MGLFSTNCNNCGSKEHASSDCPHGFFSNKCSDCGSIEHSTNDCPHAIFSSKCSHCGSIDHASSNCPHAIFSTKCNNCGSKEHSTNDCPHDIFSSKCGNCGSTNHKTSDCPHGLFSSNKSNSTTNSVPQDEMSTIFFFIKWGIIISIAIFIIIVAVFLAPIILLIWYLVKKREMTWVAILGMIFSAYLIYDITSGGFITNSLMKMQRTGEEKYIALGYFVIFITTLGFFIDKYTSTKIPVSQNGNFFEQKSIKKRRPLIAGFSLLLLVIFSVFHFVNFSGDSNSSFSNNNESNTNNSTNVNQSQISTSKNINKSDGKTAMITDPDGFTNVREGKGTNTSIIYQLQTNENFTVFPSNEKWWRVVLSNGNNGYIFHDRVHIINNNLNGKYPIASNKVLTHNEIRNLTKNELQIMRNEIFARHGYIFIQGGNMDRYFRKTNWYRPQFNNVDSKLTQIEKKNIEIIQQYEK